MKIHTIRLIYNIVLALLIVVAISMTHNSFLGLQLFGKVDKETYELSIDQAKTAFDNAKSISSSSPWCVVLDSTEGIIGVLLHSNYYSPTIEGYNGKVPLVIAIDGNSVIKKVVLLPNRETGDFIEALRKKNFLDSWNGINMSDVPSLNIDAITGATQTSSAIINNVNNTIKGAEGIFDVKIDELGQRASYYILGKYVMQVFVLIFALVSFFYSSKMVKYRWVLLGLNVIVFGFWLTSILTISTFYNWMIFGSYWQSILFAIFVISIVLPLFFNRNFYCQYVCPFGCAQELCSKVRSKKIYISDITYEWLRLIRKTYLVAIACCLIVGWEIDLTQLEPFLAFRLSISSIIPLILAFVIIVLSFFVNRPWCKYLCPTGLIIDLLKHK